MNKLLSLLLFPLLMFAQDPILTGDVDCSGEVNSEDASLILQFVTNVINELPCQNNMTGLTPAQLQEIINMMDEQLSISYNGSGGDYPVMISSISTETMTVGDAFVYCNDLEEGGNTDWFLPNLDQLLYAISGGCEFPDERTDDFVWSTTSPDGSGDYYAIQIASGYRTNMFYTSAYQCRCVRFKEGESSGSSNSSGSSSSISGNSEQTITMIGPMYRYNEFPDFVHRFGGGTYASYEHSLYFFDAVRFCSQLEYDGYNDWYLPSYHQILNYYNTAEDLEIPNFNDTQVDLTFWTSTHSEYNDYLTVIITSNNWETNSGFDGVTENNINYSNKIYSMGSTANASNQVKCFCVR